MHLHLRLKGLDIPTIITAYDDSDARCRCEAAGATAYLLKPLDEIALLMAISDARSRAS